MLEYKTCHILGPKAVKKKINKLAKKRWNIVTMCPGSHQGWYLLVFVRAPKFDDAVIRTDAS